MFTEVENRNCTMLRRFIRLFCCDFNGWADGTLSQFMTPPPDDVIAKHMTDDGWWD